MPFSSALEAGPTQSGWCCQVDDEVAAQLLLRREREHPDQLSQTALLEERVRTAPGPLKRLSKTFILRTAS